MSFPTEEDYRREADKFRRTAETASDEHTRRLCSLIARQLEEHPQDDVRATQTEEHSEAKWHGVYMLLDILQAATDARDFVATLDQVQFERSKLHQYAVARSLKIIDEAARELGVRYRNANPHLPWHQIVELEIVLSHDASYRYPRATWNILHDKLPLLIAALRPLILPEGWA